MSDHSSLRAMPPCALQAKHKDKLQTVVAKIDAPSWMLEQQQKNWIWSGGGAAAYVEITTGESEGRYLVLTALEETTEAALKGQVTRGLATLAGNPSVEWTSALTRRLQRLFCWGDAASTREDAVRATGADSQEHDAMALRAAAPLLVPQARVGDSCDDLAPFPAMFDALRTGVVQYRWLQHPVTPLPFFVVDQVKPSDQEKVTWIRQELGSGATLPDFCAMYLELFGHKKAGVIQQKGHCLKLYGLYHPTSEEAKWKREGELPPIVMQEFQRVWESTAPSRCHECRKPLKSLSRQDHFCCDKCRDAGFVVACVRCTAERACDFCTMRAPSGQSKLDQALRQGQEDLERWRRNTGQVTRVAIPNHEPAWKRRKKS